MAFDPWSYADKTGLEHAHQTALFMWANMAMRFGPNIANDPHSYTVAGFAQKQFEGKGGLGFIKYSAPIPQLKWLHAVHNQGHGDAIRGAKAKAEGVKAGVSDLFLPVPLVEARPPTAGWLGDYHGWSFCAGLYLELKVGSNTPSEQQLEFMDDMRAAGYQADWVVGWEMARERILAYLQINC